MVAFLILAALFADAGEHAMRVPRVLSEGDLTFAMASDGRYVYAQSMAGLFAWDQRGERRRIGSLPGGRDTSFAVDRDHVYVISEASLWRVPKPGVAGRSRRLAATGSSLGVAVDDDWAYLPDVETSQLFRVAKTGGTPTPLVTGPVEKTGTTVSEAGQGVLVDGPSVYWTCAGKILRVPRAGGPAQVLFQSPTLAPLSLAMDDMWLYFAEGKQTYRLRKSDGGAPEPVLDCLAERTFVTGEWLYATCDKRLLRMSRDLRRRELLDEGPTDKLAVAIDRERVYFADDASGTISASLLSLSLDEKQPATDPEFAEASLSIRRWLRELGTQDGAARLPAPVHVHLEPDLRDGFSLDVMVKDEARLRSLGQELRERQHPLLDFTSRFAWKDLSRVRDRSGWSKEKRRVARSGRGEIVLISHRASGNCPYTELVVALARQGKDLVPRRLYFEASYECE